MFGSLLRNQFLHSGVQSSFFTATRLGTTSSVRLSLKPSRMSFGHLPRIRVQQSSAPKLGLLLGALGCYGVGSIASSNSVIHNDVGLRQQPAFATDIPTLKPVHDKAFGGKLDYSQLTMGSLFGFIIGVVIGKLSSVLVFVTVSSFLTFQFLRSRGIVTMPVSRIVKLGTNRVDVGKLFFDQPSFNVSFFLAFVVAAFNV
ncbi:unnamed protein product [Kuraishia capsulata CBS 1993]|uniref:Uncharacterized protein n=1 Tax=Kuraishia capsulata CBS 1993 TaxID=1382522 RepID=W6MS68_9ASCO|nr:uncharacterized protein KUCA_T00005629001 [Kuraishia capsulata CBS 1993]CDK29636.1 unnamed protein product [Kuraishia capsulata CBS 1993]